MLQRLLNMRCGGILASPCQEKRKEKKYRTDKKPYADAAGLDTRLRHFFLWNPNFFHIVYTEAWPCYRGNILPQDFDIDTFLEQILTQPHRFPVKAFSPWHKQSRCRYIKITDRLSKWNLLWLQCYILRGNPGSEGHYVLRTAPIQPFCDGHLTSICWGCGRIKGRLLFIGVSSVYTESNHATKTQRFLFTCHENPWSIAAMVIDTPSYTFCSPRLRLQEKLWLLNSSLM